MSFIYCILFFNINNILIQESIFALLKFKHCAFPCNFCNCSCKICLRFVVILFYFIFIINGLSRIWDFINKRQRPFARRWLRHTIWLSPISNEWVPKFISFPLSLTTRRSDATAYVSESTNKTIASLSCLSWYGKKSVTSAGGVESRHELGLQMHKAHQFFHKWKAQSMGVSEGVISDAVWLERRQAYSVCGIKTPQPV